MRTGDLVFTGVCTLVIAGTAQSPAGTTPPVRTARPSLSRQCAQLAPNRPSSAHGPTVYTADLVLTGVCTPGFPSWQAVYTADHVFTGVCTLITAGTAQSPAGTTPPVRTARPRLSRQCAQLVRNRPSSAHGPNTRTYRLGSRRRTIPRRSLVRVRNASARLGYSTSTVAKSGSVQTPGIRAPLGSTGGLGCHRLLAPHKERKSMISCSMRGMCATSCGFRLDYLPFFCRIARIDRPVSRITVLTRGRFALSWDLFLEG